MEHFFATTHPETSIQSDIAVQSQAHRNASISLNELPFSLLLIVALIFLILGGYAGSLLRQNYRRQRMVVRLQRIITLERMLHLKSLNPRR